MTTENTLIVIDKAPVEIVTREQVEATIAKIRVMVPDAAKMNEAQLKHIAQESILFRTLPGKDVHYFLNPSTNKVERVEDYKYLISFTENRERILTNDPNLKIKYQSQTLTPQDKIAEGAGQEDFAVRVTITTTRDSDAFRREVKAWMDLGLKVEDAIKAAKETMGEIGVSAVGVVKKTDGNIPKGWSPLQKAEKLAIKNAIHKRWGAPTVDELSAYVRGMARIATSSEHWGDVPLELPAEAQARWADMNAVTQDVIERSAGMTIDEHEARLNQNSEVLRGVDEGIIGEYEHDSLLENSLPYLNEDEPIEQSEMPVVIEQAQTINLTPQTPQKPLQQATEADIIPSIESVPNSPTQATEAANEMIGQIYYKAPQHAFNALKKELGDKWTWPKPNDAAGWKEAFEFLVYYGSTQIKAKEMAGEPVEEIAF